MASAVDFSAAAPGGPRQPCEPVAPCLVLMPGMDGSGDLFEPFVQALGPRARCVVLRYPANPPMGYRELEAWARPFLPTEQPYVLLGESFSGPLAIAIASSSPPGLCGLVLCATFATAPLPGWLARRLGPAVGAAPLGNVPIRLLASLLMGRRASPVLQEALRRAMAPLPVATLRERLRAVLGVDARAALTQVKVPVMYLQARDDRIVPSSAARAVQRAQPTAAVVGIDAPHFLLQTAPERAAEEVASFARRVCPSVQGRGAGAEVPPPTVPAQDRGQPIPRAPEKDPRCFGSTP